MKTFYYALSFFFFFIFFVINTCALENPDMRLITDQIFNFSKISSGEKLDVHIPEELRDLSSHIGISALVSNTAHIPVRIEGFLNDEKWINSCIYLNPGEQKQLDIDFKRTRTRGTADFPSMNGLPAGTLWHWYAVDPTQIEKLTFIIYGDNLCSINISNISAYGHFQSSSEMAAKERFYPFIDLYGQYKYAEWPGKINTDTDLKEAAIVENIILQSQMGPIDRNKFGGWANGPQKEPTSYFRVEKNKGKWWMIDPEGRLFWSHGVTCVNFRSGSTRLSGREKFYERLPDKGDPLFTFFGTYNDQQIYNYTGSNLWRKYGVSWREEALKVTMKRLKSWGLTSFGNWSDPDIYLRGEPRMPNTVAVSPRWSSPNGLEVKFPDVFYPSFKQIVAEAMTSHGEYTNDDLYCIGYFVDNDLHVGALDRDHFHTGLRSVSNQQQRAEAYYHYVKAALQNPQIVGTHWFQYEDQAFTGRGEGENYQIGMVDICDNPYPELVEAVKRIGY